MKQKFQCIIYLRGALEMMYEFLFSQISNWIGLQDNKKTSKLKLLKTRRFTKNTKK